VRPVQPPQSYKFHLLHQRAKAGEREKKEGFWKLDEEEDAKLPEQG
jgi:hypothetical protein